MSVANTPGGPGGGQSTCSRIFCCPCRWVSATYAEFQVYWERLNSNYGNKFVRLLFGVYLFNKGIAYYFIYAFQLPFYNSYNVSSVRYQSFYEIMSAPWSMKGFIGVLSDGWPLFGYHKKTWMLIVSTLGTLSCLFVIVTPWTNSNVWIASIFLFLTQVQVATNDLLCEGKYAEMMGEMPETKADVVTFVWCLISIGSVIGYGGAGWLTDYVSPVRFTLIVAFVALLCALPPIIAGYMPEERLAKGTRSIQWNKLRVNSRIILLATLMATGGLVLVILVLIGVNSTNEDAWDLIECVYCCAVSVIFCGIGYWALPLTLANCNTYMYLQEVTYISLTGALDYWYTAAPNCVPGGPDFSYTYYIFWVGIIGSLAGILGVIGFQKYMSNWTFRSCFWVTTIIRCTAACFDIVIVERWNIDIGIPDTVMYMFGDAIVYQVVVMLNFMPAVVLTSKLCPKHLEATVYALLAGFQNFGSLVSTSIGTYVQSAFDVELSEDGNCTYSNLPWLILFGHIICPMIQVPLTFLLIPNLKLDDDFLEVLEMESIRKSGRAIGGSTKVQGDESNNAPVTYETLS